MNDRSAVGRAFDAMWEGEKRSTANFAAMWEQRDQARVALLAAKEKLKLYRAAHSGEYVGGVEYSALMRQIDEALR